MTELCCHYQVVQVLEVSFATGETRKFSAELLRVCSPSAENCSEGANSKVRSALWLSSRAYWACLTPVWCTCGRGCNLRALLIFVVMSTMHMPSSTGTAVCSNARGNCFLALHMYQATACLYRLLLAGALWASWGWSWSATMQSGAHRIQHEAVPHSMLTMCSLWQRCAITPLTPLTVRMHSHWRQSSLGVSWCKVI
jgi:hypothetical protein